MAAAGCCSWILHSHPGPLHSLMWVAWWFERAPSPCCQHLHLLQTWYVPGRHPELGWVLHCCRGPLLLLSSCQGQWAGRWLCCTCCGWSQGR
jgi:hypothetical protein